MASCNLLVPCNSFSREIWAESLGEPGMYMKNGFVQEYYEVLEMPRPHTVDYLPLSCVDEEDCCDVSSTVAVVNECEQRAPETAPAHGEVAPLLELENTTMMVQNLPPKATRQTFLETRPPDGFHDHFLHVSLSFAKNPSIGCIFINWVTHAAAIECSNAWDWALVDGRDKNLLQFMNDEVSPIDPSGAYVNYQPALFDEMMRVSWQDVISQMQLNYTRGHSDYGCDATLSTQCIRRANL